MHGGSSLHLEDEFWIKAKEVLKNHIQDDKLQSGTSSIPLCPKLGLQRHGYSLQFQIILESQNLDLGTIKAHESYTNHDQDPKAQLKPQNRT